MPETRAVSFMKVRASYGVIGNNNIGNYTQYATVSTTNNVVFGSTVTPGTSVTTLSNNNLGWETTKQLDIRRIRFVTPDVAIVDIDNEIHGVKKLPGGIPVPADGILKTQLMEVFVRQGDQWWVEAYHNVDIKPDN